MDGISVFLSKRAESQLESILQDKKSKYVDRLVHVLREGYWLKEGLSLQRYVLERSRKEDDPKLLLSNLSRRHYLTRSNVYIYELDDIKVFYAEIKPYKVVLEIIKDNEIKNSVLKLNGLEPQKTKYQLQNEIEGHVRELRKLEREHQKLTGGTSSVQVSRVIWGLICIFQLILAFFLIVYLAR